MSPGASAFDATIEQKWEQTLAVSHSPDQTISANLEETKRITKSTVAEGLRRLGYTIGVELGRGGLGLVNVARQEVFDRDVAVKRLLAGDGDRDAAMKFFAEALVTAQLEHPHIVPIHDLGANADGQLQLVMKRVEGFSWRDLLHPRKSEHQARASGLSLEDHLDILLKVCDAMSFAHGRGVLHRDLKPENVMVGSYGEVLVMDWGCAVAFGDHDHHPVVPRVDEIAHIAGTPSYMAPEMVMVQADRIGPQSDVYLLGAILYEVLTLKKPHHGGNVYEVLRDAAQGVIELPRVAAPQREIPDELADICMTALAKNPTARIGEVSLLAARIRDYRRHAQAVTLVTGVRNHLTAATAQPRSAAAHLRKAVSGAEQALEIWSEWPTAKKILLEAVLADARCHLAAGAATLAAGEADRAAALAKAANDRPSSEAAKALGATARTAAHAQATRLQQLRFARIGAVVAGILLVVGLSAFVLMVRSEQRQTSAALAKAEAALAALGQEQTGRSGDQKLSAPALVAQARKAMASKDWQAAITALRTAITFDPNLVEARQLLANVLTADKQYAQAIESCEQWLAVAKGNDAPPRLRELCRTLMANADPVVQTETQMRLAEVFELQGLFILAETTAIPAAKRLALYRKRVDAAWSGAGAKINMREDGKLEGFIEERKDVIDLEPLRGMPFSGLWLRGSKMRTLEALAGMPLEQLHINDTTIVDLTPLRGMRLRSLNICDTKIRDLSPLVDMPLEWLWGYHSPLSDLSPLRGMPLRDVNLRGCQIADLSPFQGLSITTLVIGSKITNLEPLRGMPLTSLVVDGEGDIDLSPLGKSPLHQFEISTDGAVDLSGLPTSLTTLRLNRAKLKNPRDLARLHLRHLHVDVYEFGRSIDLQYVDGSQVESLSIGHCEHLALTGIAFPRLQRVYVAWSRDIDLVPLASSPLVEVNLNNVDPETWRSLSALRKIPTLVTIVREGGSAPAAEFWAQYSPDIPLLGSLDRKVNEPLIAIVPPATKPGLAWQAMTGINNSVNELAQAAVVSSGVADHIALEQPFPELKGLRYTGYLTVPTAGEYVFVISSDDGVRLQLGKHIVVEDDGGHAARDAKGIITLTAGAHPFSLLYYNGIKGAELRVSVSGPGLPMQELPAAWLSH